MPSIVGMQNGEIIRIVMRPGFFVQFLDVLFKRYDQHIKAGVIEFLGIEKQIENFDEFKEKIIGANKPVFLEINLLDYGQKMGIHSSILGEQFDERPSMLIWANIISKITDNLVRNSDFDYNDFEITMPYCMDGSRFYMRECFTILQCNGYY